MPWIAVDSLGPEHEHLETWNVERRLDYLQRGIATHQPRRDHRHKVGVRQHRAQEQEVRHGQRDSTPHSTSAVSVTP